MQYRVVLQIVEPRLLNTSVALIKSETSLIAQPVSVVNVLVPCQLLDRFIIKNFPSLGYDL